MYIGILHTHTLIVVLYFILLSVKTFLLLGNKLEKLEKVRKKTKILEMVLGTLFLLTGLYLFFFSGSTGSNWVILKICLVIMIVVFGIFAFNRKSKLLGALTMILYIYTFFLSHSKNALLVNDLNITYGRGVQEKTFEPGNPGYDVNEHGEYLYTKYCIGCHGDEGDKKLSGAKDLSVSTLTPDEISTIILNGKKTMPSYSNHLEENEVKALTSYVQLLRKD